MSNIVPIAGCQFDIKGAQIINVEGGLLDDNGYQTSYSSSRLLSFSMEGNLIEPTTSLLTSIKYSGTPIEICMDEVIFAGEGGSRLITNIPTCMKFHNNNSECIDFIVLWSADDIAEKNGKDKKWVYKNYVIEIMDMPPTEGTGSVIGKIRVASYAPIIEKRGTDYRTNIIEKEVGIIAASGPITNIMVAGVLFILGNVNSAFLDFYNVGIMINLYLAAFNLIPLSILDGYKIMRWNKIIWATITLPIC